jgi:lipoic acid synthetase
MDKIFMITVCTVRSAGHYYFIFPLIPLTCADYHNFVPRQNDINMQKSRRLPGWLKMQRASGAIYSMVKHVVADNHLNTICINGNCPNIGECWNSGTATFMILGDICTRACKFCATKTGKPLPPDPDEQFRLAESIKTMQLNHCVITSVDRDDLPDGGASFWAETIRHIKELNPDITIETLIPDFNGKPEKFKKLLMPDQMLFHITLRL